MGEFKIDINEVLKECGIGNDWATLGIINRGPGFCGVRPIAKKTSFYDDDMLDYLLKDIINEKARDAEKELNGYIKEKAKTKIRTFNNRIDRVVFNDPATIIFWKNGDKTVVKCQPGEIYDEEKGLALAIIKHEIGNNCGCFNDIFKKWIEE